MVLIKRTMSQPTIIIRFEIDEVIHQETWQQCKSGGFLMAFGSSKWTQQISELRLPRPRIYPVSVLDASELEGTLISNYQSANDLLQAANSNLSDRFTAISEYSINLADYSKVLATYAALANPALLTLSEDLPTNEANQIITELLASPETQANGVAAVLLFATLIASVATALTAYAVNNPNRGSFETAQAVLRTSDSRFAEFEDTFRRYP